MEGNAGLKAVWILVVQQERPAMSYVCGFRFVISSGGSRPRRAPVKERAEHKARPKLHRGKRRGAAGGSAMVEGHALYHGLVPHRLQPECIQDLQRRRIPGVPAPRIPTKACCRAGCCIPRRLRRCWLHPARHGIWAQDAHAWHGCVSGGRAHLAGSSEPRSKSTDRRSGPSDA
jgi:hypothetical protein